ncbi:dihydrofolate reductase [Palleronia sp. LCG004]|uniref:dihydrofolate reductase n=1 Tax=Palleronia sp. LCG004 TaxID=3079304 RepID=UPI0029426FC9|nr:dihydrofolate reductase [Palleronia sp. LCG004]WOI55501.1 dihydrofolate reductase [Palleronia sp. LCG004]
MITLIVARARNGAIGKANQIPWHVPADLKLFQRETLGGAIIMGRNTWESLPVKPLKGRLNIVVSRDASLTETVVRTVEQAIELALTAGHMRIYGIGGEQIYREMLALTDRLLITEVDLTIEAADAFFPQFDRSEWQHLTEMPIESDDACCVAHEWIRCRSDQYAEAHPVQS